MAEVFYRGLQYPLEVHNGQLVVAENLAIVEQNIIEVLETRPFERVMRNDYGFEPGIFDTMEPNAINARIHRAVIDQVQGISSLIVEGQIDTKAETGTYQVTLKYKVRGVAAPPLNLALRM